MLVFSNVINHPHNHFMLKSLSTRVVLCLVHRGPQALGDDFDPIIANEKP